MDVDRKALKEEYQQKKVTGGIYRVANIKNGMCLVAASPNLAAKQNAFSFAVSTNMVFDNRLRQDWEALGGRAFTFEALETLDKKKDQTQAQFLDDLQALLEIWQEKLDPSRKY
jgi:hypothetical protein